MKKNIILLTLMSMFLFTFSQTNIKCKYEYKILETKIILLFPIEENIFLYQEYIYFKYNYFFKKQDTIVFLRNNIYKGEKNRIKIDNSYFEISECDTLVNYIQNSNLYSRTYVSLCDSGSKYIGYNNKYFEKFINKNSPEFYSLYTICHNDFLVLNTEWFEYQLNIIDSISNKKKERLYISNDEKLITNDFIINFLDDFSSCNIDFNILINIIIKKTDNFLVVCNNMNDDEFFDFILKLSDFPKEINTKDAIDSLRNSKIFSNRKLKIILKL